MATATNSVAGQVLMAGDLSPSSTGSNPELRATGVTPGSYTAAGLILDAKGRVLYVRPLKGTDLTTTIGNATESTKGVASIGANLETPNGQLSVPIATETSAGVVALGTNMGTDGSGYLTITLQNATSSSKGVVQIGSGFDQTTPGILNHASWANASASNKGMVKISQSADAGFNLVDSTISAKQALGDIYGTVRVNTGPGGVQVIDGELLFHNASDNFIGIVYEVDGATGLQLTNDGFLNFTGWDLSAVPIASDSVSGKVKIGTGLSIDSTGTLNLDGLQPTSTSSLGTAIIGQNLTVNDGVVSVAKTSTSDHGLIQIGTNVANAAAGADQTYVGLRLGRSDTSGAGFFGTLKGSTDPDIIVANGLVGLSGNFPRKSTSNVFTKAQAVANVASTTTGTWTPDFSLSNVFTITASGDTTIAAPTNAVAGQITSIIVKKSIGTETFTLDAVYKTNGDVDFTFENTQALRLSIITLSSTVHLVINHGTFAL